MDHDENVSRAIIIKQKEVICLLTHAMLATEEVSNIVFQSDSISLFGKPLTLTSEILTMWVIIALIVIVSYLGTRNMQKVPHGLQNVLETIIDLLMGQLDQVLGRERARQYGPFLMTLFLLIICSNYTGLLPMSGHITGYKAPTSNLSVTAGLAIVVIVTYFITGFKTNPKKFTKFFLLSPMLPINLLDAVTRPLSLAVRLYGNIFGEEMIISFLFGMMPFSLRLPMDALSVLFGAIQAYVFMLLASIYIEEGTTAEE